MAIQLRNCAIATFLFEALKLNASSITDGLDVESLAKHSSRHIREVVACNPETPPHVLQLLVTDPDPAVKLAVALNPGCPLHVLQNLARSSDWNIRVGLASQLDVCEDILLALLQHKNPYLSAQARHALSAAAFERKVSELEIVSTTGTDYKLGELLVQAKHISEDRVTDARSLAQAHRLRLGRVLLQTGAVKASVLIEALRLQSLLRRQLIGLAEALNILSNARNHFYENEFLN